MNMEPVPAEHTPVSQGRGHLMRSPSDDNMEVVFDPYWILQLLLRHWLWAFCIFGGTIVFSLLLFLKDPPTYVATAKMKIEPKRSVFNVEQLTAFDLFSLEFYQTQIKLLQSRKMIREVIHHVGLPDYLEVANPKPNFISRFLQSQPSNVTTKATYEIESKAVNLYANNLKVKPDFQAPQIFTISYSSPDPQFSARIANQHLNYYIEQNAEDNVVYTASYIANLERLIAEADIQIASQNQKILDFKKEHKFFQIQGMSSFDPVQDIDDRLSRIREQLATVDVKLNQAESDYEFLFFPGEAGNMDSIRKEVIQSNTLDKLQSRRTELLQSWAEIKDKYLERHPQYVVLKSKLEAVENAIDDEITIHVLRAKTTLDEEKNTKAKLQEEEQTLIQEKYLRDAEWNILNNMEKAKEQSEQQRIRYFKDIENARSSRDTQQQTKNRTYQIVDYAEVPMKATNRNWIRIVMLSFAAALSFTITGVLLIELQDKSVRTPQHIEQITGISVMGCIPYFKSGLLSPIEGRIDESGAHSPAGEAFIALRTRFLFSGLISQTQTILLTSSLKGEGKSTMAVNLASSFCMAGKRVVLLDCDLRKPTLHRFFGEQVQPGLSDIIQNSETLENVLFETDMPGLFLIPAGSQTNSPSELLTSPSFDELLENLKQDFDYILIDTPSVLATPDPTILSPRMDMTILVVRSGKVVKEDLTSTFDHFRQTGGMIYSIILNGVPSNERGAYARYGYGQSYHYDSSEAQSV